MLNKVWFWLLVIGILYGFGKGAWQSYAPPAAKRRSGAAADQRAGSHCHRNRPRRDGQAAQSGDN